MATLPRSPQLLSRASEPPNGDAWLHEIEYYGYRLLARGDRGRVTRDGELLSVLDLRSGALEPDRAGGLRVRRKHYVRVSRLEGDVWAWQELRT